MLSATSTLFAGALMGGLLAAAVVGRTPPSDPPPLGTFSMSLAVGDLPASRAFYEAFGFAALPGEYPGYGETWVMLERDGTKIGLFQGMFEANTLTFNPPDVRALQRHLEGAGLEFVLKAEAGEGPGTAMVMDPDGNPVLLDQH